MNMQEVFNLVYEKLMQQGCQSVTEYGLCVYRGDNGAKCAIGCLVDDGTAEAWDTYANTGASTAITAVRIPPEYDWMRGMMTFLEDLQVVHDAACKDFRREFHVGMVRVAHRYNLEKPWEVSA